MPAPSPPAAASSENGAPPPVRHHCAAGILAGGAGRRFGAADKGWLQFRGCSFVEGVLHAIRPQVDEVLISANRSLERYRALGCSVVTDALPAGPLAGVVSLLRAVEHRHEWLLVVPCDAVLLPADWAQRFLACAASTGAQAVVLHDGARMHPTFCLLRTRLAGDAEAWLRAGNSALHRWIGSLDARMLDTDVPPNVNTPGELAALESSHTPT
jgi:molybdopterin-guanine dinucleotide biosynthesis protein A